MEFDEVLEYCETEGLNFLPWSPFDGSRRHDKLGRYPSDRSISQNKRRISFRHDIYVLLAQQSCILIIPGASKISSIEDMVRGVDVRLSDQEVQIIDRETAS